MTKPSITACSNLARRNTMPISIASIRRRPLGSSARAAARFASSWTMKSSAISIASSRRANTGRDRSPKKPRPASPSTAGPRTHRVCAAFSTNANSRTKSSRYEHRTRRRRRFASPRVYRGRSAFPLPGSHLFWLLHGPPVSRLHRSALGQADDQFLEQDRALAARPHRAFPQERRHSSLVLAAALSRDREGTPAQSPGPRTGFHQAPYRHARFRDRKPRVRVPRDRGPEGLLFLYGIRN